MADGDLSGTVLDGRYQVIEPLAEGAMGAVYRGERVGLGRAVAIKIMHHELPDELASRQRFEREAKLMALLEHPNCVSVIDFGVHDDKPYLVMDLVRGKVLLDIIAEESKLPPPRSADILRQVLAGLAHAHELGIVHRDIKPANIMVSEKAGFGQQVRILDFGLARLQEATGTKLTTGIVVGTPNYMAPEQCKGGDIDARTDLYACGVMLFEMLTGRKPFVADDPIAVVRKHLSQPAPTLASVDASTDFGDFEAVVARALAKAPADRFESAAEMAKAIDAAVAKATKLSTAALFARAVPETANAVGNQQATMSGWNLPADPPPVGATMELSPPSVLPADSLAIPVHDRTVLDPTPAGADPLRQFPPTRHVPLMPPPSLSAATKKRLLVGAGGLVAVVVVIAVAASGGDKSPKVAPKLSAGSAVVVEAPEEDPVPTVLARSTDLIAAERYDDAVTLLKRSRKSNPDNAQLAFLSGKANFGRLWWSDGVEDFRAAMKLDASYRKNPDLMKTVLKGFLTTPDPDSRIVGLMRDIGPPLRPLLEETANTHPKKALRARARAELNAKP